MKKILLVLTALLTVSALYSQVASDIRYAPRRQEVAQAGGSSDRLLDVYLPETKAPRKGYPVVLFVHGGGFKNGDKCPNAVYMGLLERGYAVVSINYYLSLAGNKEMSARTQMQGVPPAGHFHPDMDRAISLASEDALLALKWLGRHAREYGLDKRRIAVCGGSAGAMTVLNLAYTRRPKRPRIRAVVNLWGSLADPSAIGPKDPPVMTLHGDQDDLVSVEFAYAIRDRVRQLGREDCPVVIMTGRGHAQYKYVAASEELMDQIAAFLAATL